MPVSARSLLHEAALLLKRRGDVARGALARDLQGKPCKPHTLRAADWDAQGALYCVAQVSPEKTDREKPLTRALVHLDYAAHLVGKKGIVRVNDEDGLDAVLSCYREAWATVGEE